MSNGSDPLEAEFIALAVAHNALVGLDSQARQRVLERLRQRFTPELPPVADPDAATASPGRRARSASVTSIEFGPDGFVEETVWLPEQ